MVVTTTTQREEDGTIEIGRPRWQRSSSQRSNMNHVSVMSVLPSSSGLQQRPSSTTTPSPFFYLNSMVDMASNELEELRSIEEEGAYSQIINTGREKHETYFPEACLSLVYGIKGNDKCVDCDGANPQWASVTYGSLMCLDCAGKHRSMGVKMSFVRSLTMDTWTHSQILAMLEGGNNQLHRFFKRHDLTEDTYHNSSRRSTSPSLSSSSHPAMTKAAAMAAGGAETRIDSRYNHRNHGGSSSIHSSSRRYHLHRRHSTNDMKQEEEEEEVIRLQHGSNNKTAWTTRSSQTSTVMNKTSSDSIASIRYRTKAALFYREQLATHVSKVKESGRYKGRRQARDGGGGRRRQIRREQPSKANMVKKEFLVAEGGMVAGGNSQCRAAVVESAIRCCSGKRLVRFR